MIPASYLFRAAFNRAWTDAPTQAAATTGERTSRHLGSALMTARSTMHVSRQDMAARAAMSEAAVLTIEHADDAPISAVVNYMRSIGGGVELVLKTPDGTAARIDFDPGICLGRCA